MITMNDAKKCHDSACFFQDSHFHIPNQLQLQPLCFTRSDANKVFNGVLDGVRCRQTEEMYAKDWTLTASASPSAGDQPLTAAGAGAECSASASGNS